MSRTTKFLRVRFGQAVRHERERIRLSQEEFAERAEIHRTYVSSIEHGKVSVSIEVANRLALALEIKLSELVRRVE